MGRAESNIQRLDRLEAELRHALNDGDTERIESLEMDISEARIDVDVERIDAEIMRNDRGDKSGR